MKALANTAAARSSGKTIVRAKLKKSFQTRKTQNRSLPAFPAQAGYVSIKAPPASGGFYVWSKFMPKAGRVIVEDGAGDTPTRSDMLFLAVLMCRHLLAWTERTC